MRQQVIENILKEKIITIVRGVQKEKLVALAEAMYDGGIRLLELTYDASGKTSDRETAENIAMLAKHFEGRMFIGAGTVLTAQQVTLTKQAGGLFIISPDANAEVIGKTRELEMVSIPGVFTPSEITQAHRWGADFVKLFPASTLGADYIKAVKAPLSHIKMLAVGGIGLGDLRTYLNAGAAGFGLGSNIVDKKLIDQNDFEGICALAKQYTQAVKE